MSVSSPPCLDEQMSIEFCQLQFNLSMCSLAPKEEREGDKGLSEKDATIQKNFLRQRPSGRSHMPIIRFAYVRFGDSEDLPHVSCAKCVRGTIWT